MGEPAHDPLADFVDHHFAGGKIVLEDGLYDQQYAVLLNHHLLVKKGGGVDIMDVHHIHGIFSEYDAYRALLIVLKDTDTLNLLSYLARSIITILGKNPDWHGKEPFQPLSMEQVRMLVEGFTKMLGEAVIVRHEEASP